ncbi:PepSY-associated TM helix domain-containing protein [Sphingomonas canadensis]|uniref:PepSY-associated TM helix domain-containing protein n=1 Tax=Sphingomonas canadensis TaxID=1219257 RepID=A0ABW3H9F2_9SPHN|nr:PepSY-associated TM helix domain-containing protein [Sphingomonas canadensis]MCW3837477.1 PepSY domain-containing protein [Sphingomonas canadensis]
MNMVRLRKLWFQFHKWIGLLLAIAILPLCVTGFALVWHDPLLRVIHPDRYAVEGPAALAPATYADAARAQLSPGEALTKLTLPGEAGEPVLATATKPVKGGRPERINIYLDPKDARVIDKEYVGSTVFQVMHVIHGSLMIPEWGRPIVGWVGVAMVISSLTGIWLWWPLSGSVRRGFRWKRHANTDSNLHYLLGFWISVPLFVLSLTGVWISFPSAFSGFDGPRPAATGPSRAAMMRAKPIEQPATPLDAAVAGAQSAQAGPVRSVTWPTDVKPEWAIEIGRASVTVKDASGETKVSQPAGRPPQTLSRTMRQIHDGQGMPFWWQLIVFLGGLLPTVLSITGIIMWWRARKWRGALAERQRQAAGRKTAG